jgi:N utilization substance protein A
MTTSLLTEIESLGRDRGIDREVLVETLEAAMKTAAKKVFGEQRDIEAQFNEETGDIDLFLIVVVADEVENPYREITVEEAREHIDPYAEPGDELLFQIFYREEDIEQAKEQDRRYGDLLKLESARKTFGRIAAQTAKQVIIQRLRDAERQKIYEEYKDRKNELITGIVRRFERGSIIIELGRADALLPSSEQTRRESYRPGDRIQGYVKDVERPNRGSQIILSRTDPGLVIKLFEKEVPEIDEGIVKIVAVAREPGVRSKVAVYSTDNDVDPVGACVGMRGSRVQSVVQELRGEKIDIVPYNSDPAKFVCNAISPAQVIKVFLDDAKGNMELIVPDDQLSLAIGRGGQNVRLAAQLTNWSLEILSETRLREMMDEAKERLMQLGDIKAGDIETVFAVGYSKLEDIAIADVDELSQLPGISREAAEKMVEAAGSLVTLPEEPADSLTEADLEREALTDVRGIGEKVAHTLYDAGYQTPLHLVAEDNAERLSELTGLDLKKCKQILASAEKWYEQEDFDEMDREEHEEEFEFIREDLEELVEDAREKAEADDGVEVAVGTEPEEVAEDLDGADDVEVSDEQDEAPEEEPAETAESADADEDADTESEEAVEAASESSVETEAELEEPSEEDSEEEDTK